VTVQERIEEALRRVDVRMMPVHGLCIVEKRTGVALVALADARTPTRVDTEHTTYWYVASNLTQIEESLLHTQA